MAEIVQFGNVPHPPFQDRLVLDSQNGAWDRLGQRAVLGVAQHTMVGTLMGTDAWFRRGAASNGLTDYGIGDVTDGAGLDGVLFRWNDPTGKRYPGVSPNRWPWASGPCNGMEGAGPAFVAKYGVSGVNGYLVSVERSDGGNPERPPSDKYLDTFCTLTAHWADYQGIRFDEYPIVKATGLSAYYGHYEFSTKTCPGYATRGYEPAVIDTVRAILKAAQLVEAITPEPKPPKPPKPPPPTPDEEDPLADLPKSGHNLDPALFWPTADVTKGVGKVWSDYGCATGSWGAPGQPWNDTQPDGTVLFAFTNGLVIGKSRSGKIGIVVEVKEPAT